jgi:uncharacterized membrane protein
VQEAVSGRSASVSRRLSFASRGRELTRGHWLLAINVALALTLGGAVAAALVEPIQPALANAIHAWYLLLCPQRPEHSYFLLGHQLALEQREISMFNAQLFAGLLYGPFRERWTCWPGWPVLVILAVPMACDGLSQALGFRASDWQTRTWTGALFSLGFALWFYPHLERTLRPSRRDSSNS